VKLPVREWVTCLGIALVWMCGTGAALALLICFVLLVCTYPKAGVALGGVLIWLTVAYTVKIDRAKEW
jgi:hypothetical protein